MPRLAVLLFAALMPFAVSAAADLGPIKEQLQKALPGVSLDGLRASKTLSGFYELELDMQLLYVSADGKHLFVGDVIDLTTRRNLSEAWRGETAKRLIDEVGEANMIVIGPAKAKRTITVFTDVDCPYCARLHLEVPELNRQGVKVRYLLFPRAGAGSETYRRSVAVWCASDRVKTIGQAKARKPIDMKDCKNPVETHQRLGERLGVQGTPTLFLDDGRKIGGYVPSAKLLSMLGLASVPQTSNAR